MDELINALTKVQTEIQHASKDAINPYFKSEYATLEQVITQVKKPLNDNGIYFQQIAHPSEIGACVETVFYGHGSSLSTGQILIPADKRDAQGFGSALTYAKRYSLSFACGIGHQKADDANRAMPKKYQLKIGSDFDFLMIALINFLAGQKKCCNCLSQMKRKNYLKVHYFHFMRQETN